MPLPWKKGKFSRILADRIHSAKRGGPLVVETGFPTSLVDLFVKNRDGLKRSSKKRKDRKPDVEQLTGEPFPGRCPAFASPARSASSPEPFQQMFMQSPTISRSSSFSSSPAIWRTPPHHSFSGSPIRGLESPSAAVSDEAEVADGKGVLIAIVKVFFVVALGLGTKQFIVGLIISAFSLIFMEFAGKCLCRLLKPCRHAQISLRHFLEQVTRIKNDRRCSIEGQPKQNPIEEEKPSSSFPSPKPNHNHLKPPRGKEPSRMMPVSRSFRLKPESDESPIGGSLSHCRSLNWLSDSMNYREEAAQKSHHHHRSGSSSKIKSKIIKMLTPKKKDEIEGPIFDLDQKTSKNRSSSRLKSKIIKIVIPNRMSKNWKKKQTQTNEENNHFLTIEEPIVCYDEELWCTPPSRVMPTYDEDREERRNDFGDKTNRRSRGCCVVLLAIILMGLVGGRFWAIALTLAWFSIWKFTKSSSSSSSRSCS